MARTTALIRNAFDAIDRAAAARSSGSEQGEVAAVAAMKDAGMALLHDMRDEYAQRQARLAPRRRGARA